MATDGVCPTTLLSFGSEAPIIFLKSALAQSSRKIRLTPDLVAKAFVRFFMFV